MKPTAQPSIKRTFQPQFKIQTLRRIVQLGFVGFIGVVTTRHILLGDTVASAEAFCPFGGVETLYSYLSGGRTINHTHLSNLVILLAVAATALVARGAFCGWICPLGTIQEWVHSLSRWMQRRIPPLGRALRAVNKRLNPRVRRDSYAGPTLGQRIDRVLSYGRYLVLAWIIGTTIVYGTMVFRDYDPWAALLNLAELQFGVGSAVLVIALISTLFVERAWCRYACPLGATVSLIGKFSPLRIERNATACTSCGLCSQRCPMGIDVARADAVSDLRCISCLRCVSECPRPAAIDMRLAVPVLTTANVTAPNPTSAD